MQNRALEMEVFVAIVSSGSFSNAAGLFGISPSAVSKLVTRLENRLGVQLLVRSTRGFRMTEEGRSFYEACREIVQRIENAEAAVAMTSEAPSGLLRVSCNVPFGTHVAGPLVHRFLEDNPGMRIELALSDDSVDLIAEKTDVAIRTGNLRDSTLRSRRLMDSARHVVASRQYLKNHGTPKTPDELQAHNCLAINGRPHLSMWPFRTAAPHDEIRHVEVRGRLMVNNGESLRTFALEGAGIARLSEFHVRADIERGDLVPLLVEFDAKETEPITAVYSAQSHVPGRIRKFLDYMSVSIRQNDHLINLSLDHF